jgi:hypothetical protein
MIRSSQRTALLAGSALLLLATGAVAGSGVGGVFNLGQINTVNARTQLSGSTAAQQLLVVNSSTSGRATAVQGSSVGGAGVLGQTQSLYGLRGLATGATGLNYGVLATTRSPDGLAGLFQNTSGTTNFNKGAGIRATAADAIGADIPAGFFAGGGEFLGPNGVIGFSTEASGDGVLGLQGSGSTAIRAIGRVVVQGTLTKTSGTFRIDHPLDPANKYLSHSFVESPDMMNIYNGNVTTDANGEVVVELPDYFEALNRDPRYQLTVIGSFAAAQIAREVSANRFAIRTSEPGVKVSWQVTGIRQDAYAAAHPIIVEEEKKLAERGRYLHPEEHGMSAELAIGPAQSSNKAASAAPPMGARGG